MVACLKTLFHFEVFPMIDLNHGSGVQYTTSRPTPDITTALSDAIDIGLGARQRSERPRRYVSSSGLGRACLRQIQYDYLAVPKDEGQDFAPKTLRILIYARSATMDDSSALRL